MNIAISFIGAIIDFVVSSACSTWNCSQEELDKMKIVKGYLPADKLVMLDDVKDPMA